MKALVIAANLVGRVGEWVLSRADRKPCEFANVTDES